MTRFEDYSKILTENIKVENQPFVAVFKDIKKRITKSNNLKNQIDILHMCFFCKIYTTPNKISFDSSGL